MMNAKRLLPVIFTIKIHEPNAILSLPLSSVHMAAVRPLVPCDSLYGFRPDMRHISGTARRIALVQTKKASSRSTAAAAFGGVGQPGVSSGEAVSHRRSGNYEPNSWTDFLLSLNTSDTAVQEEILTKRIPYLKDNITHSFQVMLRASPLKLLEFVDTIQLLGLGYHFKQEITIALDHVKLNMEKILSEKDLHSTSLLFRLLRENGYEIREDIFGIFINEEGSFAPCVLYGINGLLSLYEASFYSFDGENILEKAGVYTSFELKALLESHAHFPEKEKVLHSIEVPINWKMPRLHTPRLIDMYSKEEGMQKDLLELAQLDFSQKQHVHQSELKELANWWSKLGLAEKMPYTRDRLVELFLLTTGMQPELDLGYFRVEMSKVMILFYVIDDLYDVYGTLEEVECFTEVLERWDIIYSMNQLPDYMKICFMALFNTVNEVAYKILRDKGIDVTDFLRKLWVNQCNSFLVEAKWYHENHIPTLSNYLKIAGVSIGNSFLLYHAYVLLSQDLKKEEMESLAQLDLLHWNSIICRLVNDLTTTMNEKKRGDVAKAVECYMHHEEVSEEFSRIHIHKILRESWKMTNRHRSTNHGVPKFLVDVAINYTRTIQTIYMNGDGVGFPNKIDRDRIMSLLFETIPVEKNY